MAASLLGKSLVTNQNAPDGQPVNQVLVEETLPIARELYLSLLVDRETERVAIVASAAGGMDIEEVAHATPEKVLTRPAIRCWACRISSAVRWRSRWS